MAILSLISSIFLGSFFRKALLCVLVVSMINGHCFGQVAAVFEYDSPQTYDPNVPISPLSPKPFGGDPVPPNIYGEVSTFAAGTSFATPQALTKDAAGNIYVIETSKKVIWKITPNGTVALFAGVLNTSGNTDGPFGTATFTSPAAAAFDSQGNMFVSDNVSNLIRKITPNGIVSTFAGDGVATLLNGTGTGASFNKPFGLAIDANDNIYVADAGNNVIRKIAPTSEVTTFSGSITGQAGTANGNSTTARFALPKYITIDGANNLYVSGTGNNTIRKVNFIGTVFTIAGTAAGVPPALQTIAPSGLTATFNGDLFFGDLVKHQILKITSSGDLVVIAGTGSAGSANGIGTSASFNKPQDVRFDNDGNLYVADQINNLIRKIVLTGYTIDHSPPPGIVFDQTTGIFSGTPTSPYPPTTYTVTGYNAGGASAPATVNITITPPPFADKPNIAYVTPQTYSVGTAIPLLKPTNTGGNVPEQVYGESSLFATGPGYLMSVTADRFGNIYASEWNLGRVSKVSVSPIELIAGSSGGAVGYKDGPGDEALFTRPFGIVSDANGNMYVAEEGNNQIRKISGSAPWTVSTLAVTGLTGPQGLAINPSGNFLYVADRGNSAIKKINLQTDEITTINAGALKKPGGVDVDAEGNLYIADTENDAIKKVTSVGVVSVIASGLNNPREVRVDETGNVYFTDQLNNAVKRIAPDGTITTVLSGIAEPIGLALDKRGNLYVGVIDRKVYKMSVSGYIIDKPLPAGLIFDPKTGIISGTPTATSPATVYSIVAYNGDGNSNTTNVTIQVNAGPVAPAVGAPPNISYQTPQVYVINNSITALFPLNTGGAVPEKIYGETSILPGSYNTATAVAADANYIYVCDWDGNVIKRMNVTTNAIDVIAGTGASGSADGPANAATFTQPDGIILDPAGNIYIADQSSHKIRKLSSGVVSTLAGSGNATYMDATGIAASFNNPRGLAIDAAGNLYVADQGNNLIRKITPAGIVTTFGGNNFNSPTGVGIDASGTLYVADAANNAIKKISPAGVVTLFATGFDFPREIKIDGTGNCYVTDQNSKTVKRISPAGVVTTIATGLNGPIGLCLDGQGNLYVADGTASRVIKINVSGYTIDKPLPSGLSFDKTTGIITGKPTLTSPATVYTITAYNGAGSSTTSVTIQVDANAPLIPQTITFPEILPKLICNAPFKVSATSTNPNLPIHYEGDNPAVADVDANTGMITLNGIAGAVNITATQAGNGTYADATPKTQKLIVNAPFKDPLSITIVPSLTTAVCSGTEVAFTAKPSFDDTQNHYQWKVNGIDAGTDSPTFSSKTFKDGDEVLCIVKNNTAACGISYTATSASKIVHIIPLDNPAPTVSIVASNDKAYAETPITFTAKAVNATSNISYQWQVNGVNAGNNSATFTAISFKNADVVTCTIITGNCAVPTISNAVTLAILPPLVVVSTNAFTPNGDGVNDLWIISGLSTFPGCVVSVYNRLGQNVYQSKGYSQPWDGVYKAKNLPFGTYYYTIDLANGKPKVTGYITIIR